MKRSERILLLALARKTFTGGGENVRLKMRGAARKQMGAWFSFAWNSVRPIPPTTISTRTPPRAPRLDRPRVRSEIRSDESTPQRAERRGRRVRAHLPLRRSTL